jgi:hypothetical protein
MTTFFTKVISYKPAGKFRYKFGALLEKAAPFKQEKVEELLERIERRIGKAKGVAFDFVSGIAAASPRFITYEKLANRPLRHFYELR